MNKNVLFITLVLIGLLTTTTSICSEIALSYDRAGQLTSIDYPGRNYIHYSYDLAGNIIEMKHVAAIDWKEGDIVRDGVIDLRDVIATLKVLIDSPSDITSNTGDINSDGKIGVAETIYVLEHVSTQ
jgi:YD repeat-containing protein